MPKTREQKKQQVTDLTDKLNQAKSVVFTQAFGYTMNDANELRSVAKKNGAEVTITKKTLLDLAAKQANIAEWNKESLEGSVLTMFGFQDEVAPARIMAKFLKGREKMKFLAGILEKKAVDAQTVISLSKLPSRDELLAKLVGTINAPVSGLVNVLTGNLRGLITVLKAIGEKK